MTRDLEPRLDGRERAEPARGSRGGGTDLPADAADVTRDTLTAALDLPDRARGERVHAHGRDYRLSGDDVRTLATVGAFRVVPAGELRPSTDRAPTRPARALERLRDDGLLETRPYVVGRTRTTLVTLTDRGRSLLEAHRRPERDRPAQAFYAGVSKPRELAHDARVHQAYTTVVDRLTARGARVRRVVLEVELKRDYQRFLQAGNRGRRDGDGRPTVDTEAIAEWARSRQLPCEDGHVTLPDLRVEFEEPDGRFAIEDVEVMTPHYRGAHAAGKARAGFTRFRAVGARVGGGGGAARSGRHRGGGLADEVLA